MFNIVEKEEHQGFTKILFETNWHHWRCLLSLGTFE